MTSKTQRPMSALILAAAVLIGIAIGKPADGQQTPIYNESGLPILAPRDAGVQGSTPNVQGANSQNLQKETQNKLKEQLDRQRREEQREATQEKKQHDLDMKSFDEPRSDRPHTEKARKSDIEAYASGSSAGDPRAIIRTSLGDIRLRLFASRAPNTVRNFIQLARGERSFVDVHSGKKQHRPFYNGLTFFHVVEGFMVAAGCPYGTGRGGPGYTINDELESGLRFERPGMLAMAEELKGADVVPNTAGSQFFISLRQMTPWNGKYTIFGEVESGLEIAEKISKVPVGPTSRPIKRVYITQIDIIDQDTPNISPASVGDAPTAEVTH